MCVDFLTIVNPLKMRHEFTIEIAELPFLMAFAFRTTSVLTTIQVPLQPPITFLYNPLTYIPGHKPLNNKLPSIKLIKSIK